MIIYVSGLPASGKTTLLKMIKRRGIITYDCDDIMDEIIEEKLKTTRITSISKNRRFYQQLWKELDKRVKKLVNECKKLDKKIVITGLASNIIQVDKRYFIKCKPEELHKRYNERTLKLIIKYKTQIDEIINNDKLTMFEKDTIMFCRYGIRNGFPWFPDLIVRLFKGKEKHCRKNGFKFMSQQDIYDEIIALP